ncbi:MAG: PA14 domain-containing protein, partial [Phycisphaerales bacterium JB059]
MDTPRGVGLWGWMVAWILLAAAPRWGLAEEARSPGLRAYWTTSAAHASKLGHVDWERYDRTSTVPSVNFPSTSEGFYAEGPADWFALRLVGEIDVPETGSWTFTLSSDEGARLWIDGQLVVNDGLAHSYRSRDGVVWLDEGTHTIEVRYLERRYNAGLVLEWTGPTTAREVIPPGALWSPVEEPTFEGGEGLWVGWVRGVSHATNVGQIDWGSHDRIELAERVAYPITSGSFELGGPEDHFGANLVGQIEIDEEGEWTFELGSDESAMLLIDGSVVVADASAHSFRWKSGTVTLAEGLHRVEVRYLERRYSAGLFLAWRGPSDAHTSIVPSSAFHPGAGIPSPTAGEGLRAYWSEGVSYAQTVGQIEWADSGSVTGVSQVYWASTSGAFLDGGATDYFAVRLVARVSVPRTGTWSFNLGSDESARLYVDDRVVVDDASAHSFRWKSGTVSLSAGEHDIEVRFLERRYSAGLVLTWQGPGDLVEQVIPRSAFSLREEDPSMGEGGSGLRASWLTSVSHATNVGQVDWTESDSSSIEPNVSWASTGEAFYEGGPTDYFAVRLTGTVSIESGGAWTFGLGSDESARLYIDGELVINDDSAHSFRWKSREVELEAGEHAIEVQYLERRYSAGLVLTWTPPGGIETVVPPSAFSHPANDTPYDSGSGGVHAYWSEGLSHATKVGQVDWDQHATRSVEDNLSWRLTSGAFREEGATDYFAVRLLTRLDVPADGVWTFGLGSDESALLFIDGEPVVIDASAHSFRWKTGSVTLEAGAHDLEVWYLERRY